MGSDDVIVPQLNSRIISEGISGSQLAGIRGAGHGLMYQEPERFCDRVLEFLNR
jgi:pimeloyl-ACP methyl ester carboxylesterase